jgi:hypothetical protein
MKLVEFNSDTNKELLVAILESSPTGMDIGEVRKSIKLIDKIQNAEQTVTLEDAEYEYLKTRYFSTKFTRVNKEITILADNIENAKNI